MSEETWKKWKETIQGAILLDSHRFHGKNYIVWKFSARNILLVRDLWIVVDGKQLRPNNVDEQEVYDDKDREDLAGISMEILDDV